MGITLDDVAGVPELDFEQTRTVGEPSEIGLIAPVRGDPDLVKFEPENFIFGYYHDAKSENHYLIHSESLRPFGGRPEATRFDQIHTYQKVRDYALSNSPILL